MRVTVAMQSLLVLSFSLALVFVAVACGSDDASDPSGDAVDGDGDDGGDGDGQEDLDALEVDDADLTADVDGPGSCASVQLQDAFSGPELDASLWGSIGASGISAAIADERLTFTPSPGFDNTRTILLRSLETLDLTDCATWVEVPRALPAEVTGELTWSVQVGDEVAFVRVLRPNLQFVVSRAGTVEEASVPFDETAHRWWRIRDNAGVITLETSPTGHEWTVQLEDARPWDLGAARLGFGVIVHATALEFEGPQFDNVNRGP